MQLCSDELKKSEGSRREKVSKIIEQSKTGNRILVKQRVILEFIEVVDMQDEVLLRETTNEIRQQNMDKVKQKGINLDEHIYSFVQNTTQNENIELARLEYASKIDDSLCDCTQEAISELIKSINN